MNGQDFYRKLTRDPQQWTLHPKLAAFLQDYLVHEKAKPFGGQWVINTHLPPYPSPAFDAMMQHFDHFGQTEHYRRLFSVTLALTNRCPYRCWHCYNAGRAQEDLSLATWQKTILDLQTHHVISVTLSGGEPLLRADLEQIISAFDEKTFLSLNTTGFGLTSERARYLKQAGLFALGVSLDAIDASTHDRLRGHRGAFDAALHALDAAAEARLYPYVITTAGHDLLTPEAFKDFWDFVAETPAQEVHLLEPCACGKLAGQENVRWTTEERNFVFSLQKTMANQDDAPILSSFAYLEGAQAFGCGAGLTHLYVDGSGQVSPCNLVPLSFGNIREMSLELILAEMSPYFQRPRSHCVAQILNPLIRGDQLPLSPAESKSLCTDHLPVTHGVPRFVEVQEAMQSTVGTMELEAAYDQVHGDYDQYWLDRAAAPIDNLIATLDLQGSECVFEAGCGTGYATAHLVDRLRLGGHITAVDVSGGMIHEAKARLTGSAQTLVTFTQGDALEHLHAANVYDLVFSSWVLGYVPLQPFFQQAACALKAGGRIAFLVHRQNSPSRELSLFRQLAAQYPQALQQDVNFDFPAGKDQVSGELKEAGLKVTRLWEDRIVFTYATARQVLDHLLKSGAGTAYDQALDPAWRQELHTEFLRLRAKAPERDGQFHVVHDYVACIARKPE